jgi:hypothetical protein
MLQNASFYQDRLGTNIGKTHSKAWCFLRLESLHGAWGAEATIKIAVRPTILRPCPQDSAGRRAFMLERMSLAEQEADSQQPSRGRASAAVLEQLRACTESEAAEAVCAICMEAAAVAGDAEQQRSNAARLPCGHIFHFDCVMEWITRDASCPCCRAVL